MAVRQIKFRFWDSLANEYYPNPDYLYVNGKGQVGFLVDEYGFDNQSNRYIPEQSTGLTDKNGKEVYEGDIVTIKAPWLIADEPPTGWIAYDPPYILFKRRYSNPFIIDYESELEVVGNVHDKENKQIYDHERRTQ